MAYDHAFVNLLRQNVEWKSSTGEIVLFGHQGDADLTQAILMAASQQGWELVAVDSGAMFFKRPRTAPPA